MHVSALLPLVGLFPAALGQLNTLAKAKGLKYFGSATDNGELSDTTYVSILSNTSQFGQITPGNTQKWVYTEPTQNTFSWTQGDVITSFAEGNGQLLRCKHSPSHSQVKNLASVSTLLIGRTINHEKSC